MCETIHPFEKSGLGKAPFRFVGMVAQDIAYGQRVIGGRDAGVLATTKPGGTCDACGTYIVDMYRIKSSDGKESVVGCDCVLKLGREDNKLVDRVKAAKRALNRVKNAARAAKKKANEVIRIDAAFARFSEVRDGMELEPHPNQSCKGLSLARYVDFVMERGGHSGKLQCASLIEDRLPKEDGNA